jgi:DNA polymerase-1
VKSITIIDTFGFFFRAYYALPPLTSVDGFPTGLLTGFINFIQRLQTHHQSDYLLFALDSGEETFRKELLADYKANRQKAPKDLIAQIKVAIEWIKRMEFVAISVDGFEADDVIASVTRVAKKSLLVRIISNDKDLYQLIDGERVLIYDWVKRSYIDEEKCIEKFGVTPKDFVDFQALLGDSSDNVPGVRGVGVKTASKLINSWGSLENIYSNIDKITPKRVQNLLINSKNSALLSRELVRLRDNLFEDLDIESFKFEKRNHLSNLKEEFKKYQMEQAMRWAEEEFSESTEKREREATIKFESIVLNDKDRLFETINRIPKESIVAFDTETDSIDTKSAKLVGFSFAFENQKAYYVPVSHNYLGVGEQIDMEDAREAIKKILSFKIVGQNLKFDLSLIYNLFGFERLTPEADTMIMGWLIDSNSKVGLEFLADRYLNYKMLSYKEIVKKGDNFSNVDIERASFYACEDAIVTFKLYWKFLEIFKGRTLERVFQEAKEVEYPLINTLVDMESKGIKVDRRELSSLEAELSSKLNTTTEEIYLLTGERFNIKSTQQLGNILFEKLKLKGGKRRRNSHKYSTNEATLRGLKSNHPVVEKILEYREIQKLLSTYIKPLTILSTKDRESRVYTTFLQTGTATGRLSSKEPNLQNIPVRTTLGRKIRRAFISKNGYKLLSIDYSQIELRVLAHFSEDEVLIKAFRDDQDIHLATSIKLFGKENAVAKRDFAKSINFGLLYGMGSRKLSNELEISVLEAKDIIESYFKAFPNVKRYIEEIQKRVQTFGYVETLLGRRRYFNHNTQSEKERAGISRESVNTLFQGSASDLIKLAMLGVDEVIQREMFSGDCAMLLQIHDELIFEVKEELVEEVAERFKKIMEGVYDLRVPLKCSVNIADSWDKLK